MGELPIMKARCQQSVIGSAHLERSGDLLQCDHPNLVIPSEVEGPCVPFLHLVRLRSGGNRLAEGYPTNSCLLPVSLHGIKDKPSRAVWQAGLLNLSQRVRHLKLQTSRKARVSWNWPRPRGLAFGDRVPRRVYAWWVRHSCLMISARTSVRSFLNR
jgi:hypothetical protein